MIILFLAVCVWITLDFIGAKIFIPVSYNISNPYYHHEFKRPYFKGRLRWQNDSYNVYTNSLGFKDKSRRKIDLLSAKYRILFIGDSFTEGIGMPYEKTFVGIIDEQLSKNGCEVLNAAVSFYSPKLHYLKIKYLLENKGLKFNELYVYLDISDVLNEVVYENFFPHKPPVFVAWPLKIHKFLMQNSFVYNNLYRHLLRKTEMVKAIKMTQGIKTVHDYYQKRESWIDDNLVFEKWGRRGLDLAEENMDKLYELCRTNNIKMTVAVYPWPKEIRKKDLHSRQVFFWQDFCKKRSISFINHYPDFINYFNAHEATEKYLIKGDVHFNDEGHKLIAQRWFSLYEG